MAFDRSDELRLTYGVENVYALNMMNTITPKDIISIIMSIIRLIFIFSLRFSCSINPIPTPINHDCILKLTANGVRGYYDALKVDIIPCMSRMVNPTVINFTFVRCSRQLMNPKLHGYYENVN